MNCWHCLLMPGTIPGTGGPSSSIQSSGCPATAWSRETAAQHRTNPASKHRTPEHDQNFWLGGSSESPWMPVTWLKAEPCRGLAIQPNKEAFLNSSNSHDSEQYGKCNLPFHPLLACKSGSSFFFLSGFSGEFPLLISSFL